jgi:hypothetical protein
MTDDSDEALGWIVDAFNAAAEAHTEAELSPHGPQPAEAAQERNHQRTVRPD